MQPYLTKPAGMCKIFVYLVYKFINMDRLKSLENALEILSDRTNGKIDTLIAEVLEIAGVIGDKACEAIGLRFFMASTPNKDAKRLLTDLRDELEPIAETHETPYDLAA